jgi:DNA-directed RNA polymerase beta subunit
MPTKSESKSSIHGVMMCCIYKGFNQEDSLIFNYNPIQRGLFTRNFTLKDYEMKKK